jgi:hypothetical protein
MSEEDHHAAGGHFRLEQQQVLFLMQLQHVAVVYAAYNLKVHEWRSFCV